MKDEARYRHIHPLRNIFQGAWLFICSLKCRKKNCGHVSFTAGGTSTDPAQLPQCRCLELVQSCYCSRKSKRFQVCIYCTLRQFWDFVIFCHFASGKTMSKIHIQFSNVSVLVFEYRFSVVFPPLIIYILVYVINKSKTWQKLLLDEYCHFKYSSEKSLRCPLKLNNFLTWLYPIFIFLFWKCIEIGAF